MMYCMMQWIKGFSLQIHLNMFFYYVFILFLLQPFLQMCVLSRAEI